MRLLPLAALRRDREHIRSALDNLRPLNIVTASDNKFTVLLD